jgi:ABC-type Fe3+-hydroxamate transport system substrate-binding protein
MRFLLILLVTAGQSLVSAQESESTATTSRQCLITVDANTDYFPVKVSPTASQNWNVSYHNTYKIVTNIAANETYLLYQCGTEPPSGEDETVHSAVVEIPVVGIGVDVTPTIPFLEQLGLVSNIVAFTSLTKYISSPCLLESIEQGNVLSLLSSDEVDGKTTFATNVTNTTLDKLANAVAFTSPYNQEPAFATSVKISEYTETSNAAIFEWIKFYSVFFNLEVKANDIFALTEQRWTCVADQASRVQADRPDKPVVLWAYYSDFCNGWAAGTCPNYYCEYATQCAATLVDSSSVEGNYSEDCGATFLSTDQIVALGKEADYWIYPGEDWNTTYALFSKELDTMPAVQKRQVYDYQASGPKAWFEQRYPEYFAVLQDFCSIVGTVAAGPKKSWFRNVFTDPIGSVGTECTEQSRSNSIVPVAGSVCNDLQDKKPTSSSTKPTSNAQKMVPFGLMSLMLSFVVTCMLALV